MKGIICNVLAVAFGGLAGALFGRRLPEHFRTGLNAIFGICAMGMGISSITLMENMPAVILAVILGTSAGLLIHLGDRITSSGKLLQNVMEKKELGGGRLYAASYRSAYRQDQRVPYSRYDSVYGPRYAGQRILGQLYRPHALTGFFCAAGREIFVISKKEKSRGEK